MVDGWDADGGTRGGRVGGGESGCVDREGDSERYLCSIGERESRVGGVACGRNETILGVGKEFRERQRVRKECSGEDEW